MLLQRVTRFPTHVITLHRLDASVSKQHGPVPNIGLKPLTPNANGGRSTRCASASAASAVPSSSAPFTTIEAPQEAEIEEKKSRFVAFAWPISTPDEAISLIRGRSDPSASHNCFAVRAGPYSRANDDGEPGGTAGRPILQAIEGEKLDYVAVLVIRYYGGVKLGTGGLVRAYGQAARDCLRLCRRVDRRPKADYEATLPYSLLSHAYSLFDGAAAVRLSEDYLEDGSVKVRVSMEPDRAGGVSEGLRNLSRGAVELVPSCAAAAAGPPAAEEGA